MQTRKTCAWTWFGKAWSSQLVPLWPTPAHMVALGSEKGKQSCVFDYTLWGGSRTLKLEKLHGKECCLVVIQFSLYFVVGRQ